MKMQFLGCGSAFTLKNYQSNVLLTNEKNENLLIDCGSDIRFSLNDVSMSYKDIHAVYISHLHADHVGGLEWLAFMTKFTPNMIRPKLFISKFLKDNLWSNVLSGGLASLQCEVADINTYFNVNSICKNGSFSWGDSITCQLIQMIHIMDGFQIVPSFGLMISVNNKKVFFTSDTQYAPNQIKDFYNIADLIFHDCETGLYESGVHAHYKSLKELPENIKSKMWLYHYNDNELPNCVDDGFLGFVKKGQIFEF